MPNRPPEVVYGPTTFRGRVIEGVHVEMRSFILASVLTLAASLAQAEGSSAEAESLRERVIQQEERLEEQRGRLEQQQDELDEMKLTLDEMEPDQPDQEIIPDGSLAANPHVAYWPGLGKPFLAFKVPVGEPEGRYNASFGGHLNRSVNTVDDGKRTKAYFVDNSNLATYSYIKASAKVNEDFSIRAHLEVALQSNSTSQVSQKNESTGLSTSARFFELVADTTKYGRLSFGKGYTSSFLALELDMSGTQVASLMSVGNTAGGLLFYDSEANAYSNLSVGDSFLDLEELSSINRVRYDSPRLLGFQASGTVGEDYFRDATLRYRSQLGGFRLFAAASYQNKARGAAAESRWSGGASVLHEPTGLNLTAASAYAKAEDDGRKAHNYTVKLGWRKRLWALGETKMSVDYQKAWDITRDGSKQFSAGAFVMQDWDAVGMQIYSGYRMYHLDVKPEDLDNIHVFVVGASFMFDVTFQL
jgi:hypothetical protein